MAGPLRVALTGGLASGKSHCLAAFARLGAAVIDADALAHDVVAPGTPGLAAVLRRFGPDILGSNGALDRDSLGRLVFADAGARRDLENIIHPLVYQRLADWFERSDAVVGIAEIPLLYETGHSPDFDFVVVAACSRSEQKRRAMARTGLTETEVEQRLAAQMPLEEKVRRADYVVDTSGTPADTDQQVSTVWRSLQNTPQRRSSGRA
jgi:dephospho-CoA kinase